jgi:hypothetical protein
MWGALFRVRLMRGQELAYDVRKMAVLCCCEWGGRMGLEGYFLVWNAVAEWI